jgi:polysaccharide export outer membrane protein
MYKIIILWLILFACCFSSCISHRELVYFRDGKEKSPTLAQLPKQEISNLVDIKLQVGDVLAIIISSPDGVLASPYNIGGGGAQATQVAVAANSPATFLITQDGFIHLPTLGALKVVGLTVKEVREAILQKVSVFIQNPSVSIRMINFKISVVGEVGHPGQLSIENERITILEAIARAGDLTTYSNREHILIIREQNGLREYGEINLKDTKFFTSPYYYLQQNDVIYVEPTKGKIAQISQPYNAYVQPVQTGLSLFTILLALISVFKK